MTNDSSFAHKVIMRLIDLMLGLFILIFLFWLFLIIIIWIKFESKGPAIFRQDRVGLDGKIFVCYKFRTMFLDTEEAASHLVSSNQITSSGKLLRATKLDELPQTWNILLNDMAFVGPRPSLPNQKELIAERIQRGVMKVKPGITGWSQIKNIDMSDPVRLAVSDAEYLKLRSILLDIKIMFLTVLGRGQGDVVGSS
jgi:lipopolysaccharide/colanic/teichoic acid biosynthesis glycosyltransferase